MSDDILLKFWAKKSDTELVRYPLLYHIIDVAAVSQEMWHRVLQAGVRGFLAGQLAVPEDEAGRWLSFWAGLHDIGKATPDFQRKSDSAQQELVQSGFDFKGYDTGIYHGVATTSILKGLLADMFPNGLGRTIATVVGGHHGIFPSSGDVVPPNQLGNDLWRQQWQQLFDISARLCGIKTTPTLAEHPGHAFLMMLAGLTSVADWIASNERYFPYTSGTGTPEEHFEYARLKAKEAISDLKWMWHAEDTIGSFQDYFRFDTIRPLQQEIINVAQKLAGCPGLVVIEAPMGEGKTEAAMYLADSWLTSLKQKGCYFALPTQATSNQMFGRVKSFLEKRYPDQKVSLMLLHGHAALSAEFEALKQKDGFGLSSVDIDTRKPAYDRVHGSVIASEWFTYRKRGLLAPFGVGTVDQALLSVLQTKHVFVRLFGLAGKTVIIDEVHAYDAYMTTLLERLLEWLAALGASVTLLSATLPRAQRDSLLKAYVRGTCEDNKDIPIEVVETKYPRISWTVGGEFESKTIDTSPQSTKKLHLRWINGNLTGNNSKFELGKELREALSNGGCAAVICNTVDQAQTVYLALGKYFPDPELDLFHARCLFSDRDKREKRALVRFGKPEAEVDCGEEGVKTVRRTNRAVLVATQVIEQSLDLDFDLMVTDMAPVDLILQRAGRLQRHKRKRPEKFDGKPPTIWICSPKLKENGTPDFGGGTEAVYDRHILLRSWLALEDRKTIRIPEDVEELIEAVYGEEDWSNKLDEALRKEWIQTLEKLTAKKRDYTTKAQLNSILPPTYPDDILEDFNRDLEEDDPKVHESLQALTRVSEGPSASVICLYGDETRPCLDSECKEVVDSKTCPTMAATRKLLASSVSISHRGLVPQILKECKPVYEQWRKSPVLRHHFLLFLDKDGASHVGDYHIKIDDELGLTIKKMV